MHAQLVLCGGKESGIRSQETGGGIWIYDFLLTIYYFGVDSIGDEGW